MRDFEAYKRGLASKATDGTIGLCFLLGIILLGLFAWQFFKHPNVAGESEAGVSADGGPDDATTTNGGVSP